MDKKKNKGITLVEILVTAMIGVIIAAAVISFINITGKSTDEMAALQVLQQESSMITELFLSTVRSGSSVSDGSGAVPENDTLRTDPAHIIISYPTPKSDVEFKIEDNIIQIIQDGNPQNISTRLCTADDTKSSFTIQRYGRGVKLILTLEYTRKNKNYRYTTTTGSVRCKNSIL